MFTSIIDWLDEAVKIRPSKTIYIDPEEGDTPEAKLTVKELDELTDRVAAGILKAVQESVEPNILRESPIAVMTGRHRFTPVCFLGVAKAGGFYAPMEADLPEPRLIQILKVSEPGYVISDRENLDKTVDMVDQSGVKAKILVMEDLLNASIDGGVDIRSARDNLTESSPLYMIFTSGSTGMPKGVLTSHYSLMCYLDGLNEVIGLDDTDVLGNQSPLDYIAAVRDLYLPLMTGAETVIIPRNTTAMPEELFGVLNKYKVTTLCWSASGLEVLAKLGAFNSDTIVPPKHIKRIVFSGSVMSGKYLMMWQKALPNTEFINQYGPTETTASCTYYRVKEQADEHTVLPIGKPYKHYKVFLMEEEGLGDGVGEICVAGPALALGYYRNPEQTSKVFVTNPLCSGYDERIYLTGDLGRYNQDGDLEFLGRKDRQVKHLGHRIELVEIEGAAIKIDGVHNAISMYDGEKSLLYLFYTGEATSKDIALYFRSNMPAYMVPRKMVNLEEMPVLPNGKIDMNTLKGMMK